MNQPTKQPGHFSVCAAVSSYTHTHTHTHTQNIGFSLQRRSVFRNTATLPARAIAFAAAILFSFVASHVHAQELITITSPTAATVFEPGATFSIDVELGGEAAELLESDPTTQRLTSTFGLPDAVLTIEAVAPPGSDTDAADIQDGIEIGLLQAAYDSIAGGASLGGVTTADGLRIGVRDTASFLARISFLEDLSIVHGDTRYSPLGGGGEAGSILSRLSPLGSIHIVTFSFSTANFQPPSLQQVFQFIQAHEITIAPGYRGGAFNLRLTLAESSRGLGTIGARDTVTAEILIRGGAAGVIVPSDRAVSAVAGDTLATLTWTVAQDRRTLEATDVQYEATVTESGVSSTFTMSSSDYTLNDAGTMASFTLDRVTAVLLPDKPYELTMRACDLFDNCSDQEYSGTFRTTSLGDMDGDGIHDELEGKVSAAGGIAAYCGGGGDHADGDGDGVPNSVEVRLGTDCRSGVGNKANDFVGASGPELTVISATGTETIGSEVYLIRPGISAMTEVAAGVTCEGCTTLNAYEDMDADGSTAEGSCVTAPGLVSSSTSTACRLLEVNDGRMLLGSFSREILWVGMDAAGNWDTQVQRFYIQPLVGFDASSARADEEGSVRLQVLVAVSDDAGNFETGIRLAGASVAPRDHTLGIFSGDGIGVTITPPTEATPREVTLSLPGGGSIPGGTMPALNSGLYALGNSMVTVSVLPRASTSTPEFAFTVTSVAFTRVQPLFVDDDNPALVGFSIASTPTAATYGMTARVLNRATTTTPLSVMPSSVTAETNTPDVRFGGDIRAGDVIEVTATAAGEAFAGKFFLSVVENPGRDVDKNGIPDTSNFATPYLLRITDDSSLEVSGVSGTDEGLAAALGGYAVAASIAAGIYSAAVPDTLTMSAMTGEIGTPGGYPPGTGVFDFIVNGVTPGGVVSVLIPLQDSVPRTGLRLFKYDNSWGPFTSGLTDAYYGAPAPCPAISAPRGTGPGEWRAADDSGFQEGDECVLLEITDGGINDADGTRNGVIYDPNALGSGSSNVSGGGTMDPFWLLLAALALALSYASRRRQRQSPL